MGCKIATKVAHDAFAKFAVSLATTIERTLGWKRIERDVYVIACAVAVRDEITVVSTVLWLLVDIANAGRPA
jgi:hypothetical protein